MRSETRVKAGDLIVEIDRMAKSQRPYIELIVLGPSKGRINYHGASSGNGTFDGIFGNTIVVVASHVPLCLMPCPLKASWSANSLSV
jgi:hypothetical protein